LPTVVASTAARQAGSTPSAAGANGGSRKATDASRPPVPLIRRA
jgi:hypothetical protein